jgi:hypothetical protein
MKGFTELIGILLCIQGAGALLTKLLDGSRSWFAVRYAVPDAWQVPASAAVIVLGLLVLLRSRNRQAT